MHVWVGVDVDIISLLESLDASRLRTLIIDKAVLVVPSVSNFKHLRSLSFRCVIPYMPHSIGKLKHLRYLHLYVVQSESLPISTRNLVCLQTLRLIGRIRYIPPLERLPFLKLLYLFGCDLEYIYLEDGFSCGTFFPSLERLDLLGCSKLRGCCRKGGNFDEALSLPSFPRLSQLSIVDCDKLICIPTFPNIDKRLTLADFPRHPLEATLNITASSSSVDDFTPLSSLKSLCIQGDPIFDRVSDGGMRVNWMKNLTSLQYLEFILLSTATWQEMETCFKDDFHFFPSLKKIIILDPRGKLEALPDWMCNLSSLQHIKLDRCTRLASLPEAMPHLANLNTLEIINCPRLIEECKNEASHKIAHIPNIILQ